MSTGANGRIQTSDQWERVEGWRRKRGHPIGEASVSEGGRPTSGSRGRLAGPGIPGRGARSVGRTTRAVLSLRALLRGGHTGRGIGDSPIAGRRCRPVQKSPVAGYERLFLCSRPALDLRFAPPRVRERRKLLDVSQGQRRIEASGATRASGTVIRVALLQIGGRPWV